MAKEENEKPRRTRTAKPKSEQAPGGESNPAPAQKGPKHFSFGAPRSESDTSSDKPRRDRSTTERSSRSEGRESYDRKPSKRFDGEQRAERKFDKPRSDDRPRFAANDSAERPKRRRSDTDQSTESRPRYGAGDSTERPKRRRDDDGRSADFKPRFNSGDRSERPSRRRSDGDRPSDSKPRFGDRDGSDRPYRKRSEGDAGSESRPRFGDRDRAERPYRKREDSASGSESRPRFNRSDSAERPFRKRSDGEGGTESKPRFGSRDSSERPFRRKSDDGEARMGRNSSSDREGFKSDRPARRSDERAPRGERPVFEKRGAGSSRAGYGSDRPDSRSNDDKRASRPGRTSDDRPARRGAERKTRDEFKTTGEWLDPEDFKAELGKSRALRKENENDELGYRPDYIPAPRREYRKSTSSKPTLESKDGKIRLNKFISNAGICSRREADDLIQSGAVKVNGEIVTTLGFRVSPIDKIQYGDQTLTREKKQYLLLNKPKDYITTSNDPEGRKTVMDLVKDACRERLYPVGRLDRSTTGLLLMTNDGDLAKRLMHPSHEMRKVYHVTLNKNLKAVDLKKIAEGLELEDGKAMVDEVAWASQDNKQEIGIVLHSGKNRIVRRIFEHLGYEVEKLDRTGLAGLTKKNLPRGKHRFLTEKELIMLRMG